MKRKKLFRRKINIYFDLIDKVIISLGIISVFIIIFINVFLSDFITDENKGIVYSILTSITASSIFYIFNISIPKIKEIKGLRQYIEKYIVTIDDFSLLICSHLYPEFKFKTVDDILKSPDLIDFDVRYKKLFEDKVEFDMVYLTVKAQKNILDLFLVNYSNCLNKSILIDLNDLNSSIYSIEYLINTKSILTNSKYSEKLNEFENDIRKTLFENYLLLMKTSQKIKSIYLI